MKFLSRSLAIAVVLVLLSTRMLMAVPALEDRFQAQAFSPEEVRLLQRSLTFLGYYEGLWDRQWGPASQAAFDAYARGTFGRAEPTNAMVVSLLVDALDVADRIGWVDIPLETAGISFGIPEQHVQYTEGTEAVEFVGPDLIVQLWVGGLGEVQQFHRRMLNMPGTTEPYTVRYTDRLVTSYQRGSEIRYVRSDLVGSNWVTLEVGSSEASAELLSFVTSSFDTSPEFDVGEQDLSTILGLLDQAETEAGGSSSEGPGSVQTTPVASGTGFFVSPDRIITNAHVIDQCDGLRTPDGLSLSVLAQSQAEDLALLAYPETSEAVLSLAPDTDVTLGEQVSALGYPLYGLLNRQLNYTSGVVSAMAGIDDDTNRFTLTAPIQPGNSGGPVLNDRLQVVGVAVARVNDAWVEAEVGAVPQNINYAIQGDVLKAFLATNGVKYRTHATKADAGGGVPAPIQRAVVPVICETTSVTAAAPQQAHDSDAADAPALTHWYLAEFDGLDFYGGDLTPRGHSAISLQACQQLCADNLQCSLYTYNVRHNICFTKSDYALAQSHPDAQSGLIFPASSSDAAPRFPVKWQLHQGRAYGGRPYRSSSEPDYQNCISTCDADSSCQAFTFRPARSEQCEMFGTNAGSLGPAGGSVISGEAVDTVVEPDVVTLIGTD